MKRLLPLVAVGLSLLACGNNNSAATAEPSASKIWAKVNGQAISEKDVYDRAGKQIRKIEDSLFETKQDVLQDIISSKLLEAEAKKQNLKVNELIQKEVYTKAAEPSSEEVNATYEKYKAQLAGRPKDQALMLVTQQLKKEAAQGLMEDYLNTLASQNNVDILFSRPIERVKVSIDDDPSRGPKNAPVTIVEFTDYQCPYCSRVRPTLKKLLETYGDQVHYVLRDFPLEFHDQAEIAATAANCSAEQNKYWEYSHLLWENQGAFGDAELKKYAQDIGLDAAKFAECLASGKYKAEIAKDQKDGIEAGVSGTPAFFINGRFINGARPFGDFKKIIDEELRISKK